jgi:hypothetical protein
MQMIFSVTGSWVGYLSCFGQNLRYGGAQTVIFALLVATFYQGIITLGLSEIASAFPSTGVSLFQFYCQFGLVIERSVIGTPQNDNSNDNDWN